MASFEETVENFFTKDELLTFLESIDSQKWKTLFRVLAYSGFRKGEVLALTWNDINFKASTISVSKTLTLGLGNKLIVQTPKTKKMRRLKCLKNKFVSSLEYTQNIRRNHL